jgi:hypothetical protein
MFQFSPLASVPLWIQGRMTRHDSRRVSPFGHPRINAYVRLPEAFRSLSRPSSPVRAKASTVRPCSLDRISAHAHRCTWLYPAHRSFLDLRWCSRLLSTLLLTQLPNTRVFNQSGRERVLVQCARLASLCFRHPKVLTRGSRKEVIQPQVPLRLPCYDFAPVTELAFGGSLPCGLGHRLRALPTPMA